MTASLRTDSNGPPRKTLASQIDRLDGILDGLDAALAGAVQEAVGLAVKEAVQAVLTEVLTNHDLRRQLRPIAPEAQPAEPMRTGISWPQRLWQQGVRGVRRAWQTVKRAGAAAGLALLAAGAAASAVAYTARRRLASTAATVCRCGKQLLDGLVTALTGMLPSFAIGGI